MRETAVDCLKFSFGYSDKCAGDRLRRRRFVDGAISLITAWTGGRERAAVNLLFRRIQSGTLYDGYDGASRQLEKADITYQLEPDNGFRSCSDPAALPEESAIALVPVTCKGSFGNGGNVCPRRSPRPMSALDTGIRWRFANTKCRHLRVRPAAGRADVV